MFGTISINENITGVKHCRAIHRLWDCSYLLIQCKLIAYWTICWIYVISILHSQGIFRAEMRLLLTVKSSVCGIRLSFSVSLSFTLSPHLTYLASTLLRQCVCLTAWFCYARLCKPHVFLSLLSPLISHFSSSPSLSPLLRFSLSSLLSLSLSPLSTSPPLSLSLSSLPPSRKGRAKQWAWTFSSTFLYVTYKKCLHLLQLVELGKRPTCPLTQMQMVRWFFPLFFFDIIMLFIFPHFTFVEKMSQSHSKQLLTVFKVPHTLRNMYTKQTGRNTIHN